MRLQLDTSTLTAPDSGRIASPGAPGTTGDTRAGGRQAKNIDSIGISGTSAALGQISSERAHRIQQLTTAVRAGTYSVSGAAISSTIVSQAFTE
jgi:hypothetical protein